jgi:signal transduction histidine kinase
MRASVVAVSSIARESARSGLPERELGRYAVAAELGMDPRIDAFLRVTTELQRATVPGDVVRLVLGLGTEALGAIDGTVYEADDDAEMLRHLASTRPVAAEYHALPFDAALPVCDAMRTGEPIWFADRAAYAAAYPHLVSAIESLPDHGWAVLPLVARTSLGAMIVSHVPSELDATTRRIFVALAGQCALALERARLLAAEREAAHRLEILAKITRVLGDARLHVRELSEVIAGAVTESLAQVCGVALVGASRELEVLAFRHESPEATAELQELLRAHSVGLGSGIGGRVVATGEPLMVRHVDPQALRAVIHPAYVDFVERHPIGSVISVPLRGQDGVVGVMTLCRPPSREAFSEDDLTLVQEIADRTARAFEHARLHQATLAREATTALLYRLTDALVRAGGIASICDAALDAITQGLRVPRAAILLVDEEGTMRFVRWRGLSDVFRRRTEGSSPWPLDARDPAPALVPDVQADAMWGARRAALLAEDVAAVAMFPLVYEERVLGMVAAYASVPTELGAAQRVFARSVAGHVAAAVANARLLEAERDSRALAERASRAKDEFLAMLGHELRNPLAPILTALDIMEVRGDATTLRARQVMQRQTAHMLRLVDDLLDVTRVTQGKLSLRRERIAIGAVMASAVEAAGPLMAERGQRLHVDPGSSDLFVDADPTRLTQVITNLLTNAAKHGAGDGHVVLTAMREHHLLRLSVADDGPGFPPALLPRVFDMFVQAPQSLARTQGGLGLGLTIVKSLVELHGGHIRAQNRPAGGAEIVVWLPLAA